MKTCFIVSPIGPEDSEIRRRADLTLRHIITPACQELEYDAVRADKMSDPGIITSHVINKIISADMVVADLTGHNPNVFYELAIRHTLRRPVVQLMAKGELLPFDVAQTRTIFVDLYDLDSVASSRQELVRQMQSAANESTPFDSPVSMAVQMDALRTSDNPIEKSHFEILDSIRDLKQLIMNMKVGYLNRPILSRPTTVTVRVNDMNCNVDSSSFHTLSLFLDRCYTQFMHEYVDQYTYGESWILIDVFTDSPLEKEGTNDGRKLQEVGIDAGSILKVRFIGGHPDTQPTNR